MNRAHNSYTGPETQHPSSPVPGRRWGSGAGGGPGAASRGHRGTGGEEPTGRCACSTVWAKGQVPGHQKWRVFFFENRIPSTSSTSPTPLPPTSGKRLQLKSVSCLSLVWVLFPTSVTLFLLFLPECPYMQANLNTHPLLLSHE